MEVEILLFQDGKNSTLEISNLDFFFNQKIKEYSDLKKVTDKNEIREKLKEYNLYGSKASKSKDSKKMSDQLEKLNSLYKSGAITEAEFKKAKNRIINN